MKIQEEELTTLLRVIGPKECEEMPVQVVATLRRALARIAGLEAALKPFATLAELEDTPSLSGAEQWFLFGAKCVTYADLRAARAALGEKE